MIKSVTLVYEGEERTIDVDFDAGNLRARVRANGRLIKEALVPESSPDDAVYALIREIDALEIARLTKRDSFQFGRDTYEIEIWPVGRFYKARVSVDGEPVGDVISWENCGQFDDIGNLFDAMKAEIRFGRIRRES